MLPFILPRQAAATRPWCHQARRKIHAAVAALREAEQITPELVRVHALVRQLVSDLLTMQDPPANELRDPAGRLTG